MSRAIRPENIMANVGRRVAEVRLLKGLTQEELAEQIRISLRYLQKVERGQSNMTLMTLARWALWLKVDPSDLIRPSSTARPGRGRPSSKPR